MHSTPNFPFPLSSFSKAASLEQRFSLLLADMSQYFIKWAERLSVISSISARLLYVCMFVCLLFFAAPTPTPMNQKTTSLCCVENNDSDRLAALHDLFFLCKQLKMAIAIVIEFIIIQRMRKGQKVCLCPSPNDIQLSSSTADV